MSEAELIDLENALEGLVHDSAIAVAVEDLEDSLSDCQNRISNLRDLLRKVPPTRSMDGFRKLIAMPRERTK